MEKWKSRKAGKVLVKFLWSKYGPLSFFMCASSRATEVHFRNRSKSLFSSKICKISKFHQNLRRKMFNCRGCRNKFLWSAWRNLNLMFDLSFGMTWSVVCRSFHSSTDLKNEKKLKFKMHKIYVRFGIISFCHTFCVLKSQRHLHQEYSANSSIISRAFSIQFSDYGTQKLHVYSWLQKWIKKYRLQYKDEKFIKCHCWHKMSLK